MPLRVPNLDDRNWQDLVNSAIDEIKTNLDTNWNDLSPGDPGVVLLEAFAFLTEQMIYRLNRLPEKAYVAFLRLLGVSLYPPTAAKVKVEFWSDSETTETITIPLGQPLTMSAKSGDEAPIFVTTQEIEIRPEHNEGNPATVIARQCQWVQEESLGTSNGQPGQQFQLANTPVVAKMGNDLDLKVGIEVDLSESSHNDWTATDGKRFRIWNEVTTFANLSENDHVFIADRLLGIIQFAAAARISNAEGLSSAIKSFAAVPPKGKEIRVRYSWGGGNDGNIAPRTLDVFADVPGQTTIDGIALTNPRRAWGGLDAESIENALRRGPYEVHSLERAVTARDFEQLTLRKSPAINRVKAYTKSGVWRHAQPGTVKVVLVPKLPPDKRQPVSESALIDHQSADELPAIQHELAEKSPLGTRIELQWARYKKVWVTAELLISGPESPAEVRQRITDRLNGIISPLPQLDTQQQPINSANTNQNIEQVYERRLEGIYENGWPFGRSLRLADVSRFILATEENVSLISSLALHIADAPDRQVHALAADYFQEQTWYAASGNRLLRSVNDGAGWELMLEFSTAGGGLVHESIGGSDVWQWEPMPVDREETIRLLKPSPHQPGIVAMSTEIIQEDGTRLSPLYFSVDCGDSWYNLIADLNSEIEDMAWLNRSGRYILLLATTKGLNEVDISLSSQNVPEEASVSLIPVMPQGSVGGRPDHPVYAVAVIQGKRGNLRVAIALKHREGVYISDSPYLTRIDDLVNAEATAVAEPLAHVERAGSFRYLGLRGEDIRHLNVQYLGKRVFLWAGAMAQADSGRGCHRWQFDDVPRLVTDQGQWISQGWNGGSCYALTFLKPTNAAEHNEPAQEGAKALVLAVTAWGGVQTVRYDPNNNTADLIWQPLQHQELPLRGAQLSDERDFFVPTDAIAANADSEGATQQIVMVGGAKGVYRSRDRGNHYETVSQTNFKQLKDAITIPQDMLFLSGPHAIQVDFDRGMTDKIRSSPGANQESVSGDEHGTI